MLSIEEKFMKLTGETDENKVSLFLDNAEQKILEATNRIDIIDALNQSKLDLAVVLYNRNGLEGEYSHSEGGVSVNMLKIEEILKSAKNNFSLSPVARRLKKDAKKENEEVQSL